MSNYNGQIGVGQLSAQVGSRKNKTKWLTSCKKLEDEENLMKKVWK